MLAASVSSKTCRTEERNQSSRKKVGAPLVRKLQEKSVRNLRGNKKCEDNYTTKEEIEEILDEGTTRSSSALPVSGFAFESTPAAVP